MQDNSCAEAWPSALPEQLGEVSAQGCRLSPGHSWARDVVSHLAGSVPQARSWMFSIQRLPAGLGCAPGILSLGNLSPRGSEKANMAGAELAHGLRNAGKGLGEKRLEPGPAPRAQGPGSLRCTAQSCLQVALDALDAALTRHR